MTEEEYAEITDNYRDILIGKYSVGKMSEAKAAYMLGKLDEWEAEYDRKGGDL